jgi:general secretion pathway protein J
VIAAPEAGFTLVELLVGLALFGLLAATGLAALQGAGRIWRAGEGRAAEATRFEAAHALIRRHLEAAVPYADGPHVAFAGTVDSLVWVARRPAASMPGGFYVLRLHLEGGRSPSGGRLMLGWRSHDPVLPMAAQQPEERVVVLDGIARFTAGYRGLGEDAAWRADWSGRPALPRLIRLDLTPAAGRPWPRLVVAPSLPLLLDAGG